MFALVSKERKGMRFYVRAIFITALMFSSVAVIRAQSSTGVEQLRSQLGDIQAKEAQLQARSRQLDEDLRPENIERSLALNGSTRPEELREQRRRQLEKEKEEVRSQLDQLATSRARIESAITIAEAATYRQSAGGVETTGTQPQSGTDSNQAVKQTSNRQQMSTQQPVRRKRTRRSKPRRRG